MTEKKEYLMEVYQNLSDWLDEVKEIQKPRVDELIKQAKLYAKAAEGMTEDKLNQFTANLKYDLHDFYTQNQTEIKHSIYLNLLNESLWSNLAQLTDKSQVEWSEFYEDIEHEGQYNTGEYIGFGELECKQCHEKSSYSRLSQINNCQHCNGSQFIRNAFKP